MLVGKTISWKIIEVLTAPGGSYSLLVWCYEWPVLSGVQSHPSITFGSPVGFYLTSNSFCEQVFLISENSSIKNLPLSVICLLEIELKFYFPLSKKNKNPENKGVDALDSF